MGEKKERERVVRRVRGLNRIESTLLVLKGYRKVDLSGV